MEFNLAWRNYLESSLNMALMWSKTPHILPDIHGYVDNISVLLDLQSQRHYWLLFKMTIVAENVKSKTSHKNTRSRV